MHRRKGIHTEPQRIVSREILAPCLLNFAALRGSKSRKDLLSYKCATLQYTHAKLRRVCLVMKWTMNTSLRSVQAVLRIKS